jgi:hypothetical protein
MEDAHARDVRDVRPLPPVANYTPSVVPDETERATDA